MNRPVGQYLDGDSPVHALDPRAKIAIVAAFSVALFAVGPTGLGVLALALVAAVVLARVPARAALVGVRAVALLLGFTLVVQALAWMPADALVRIGPVGVVGPGLARGVFLAVRIVVLVVAASLVTLTTTPLAMTAAMESLMAPLARVGFPAADVAMMLAIALRFVPTTAEEADRVVTAQTVRGAPLHRGGPVARVRAWTPVLVPLFVNLFRRADRLADAMEARGYRGGEGRTRMNRLTMRAGDWAALAAAALFLATVATVL
jgi:energy-coupling factor transport system permease protein